MTNSEFWKDEKQREDKFTDFCLKSNCKTCPCWSPEARNSYNSCFTKWCAQEFSCWHHDEPARAILV